jgi:uncharacterized protein (DUF58 family)
MATILQSVFDPQFLRKLDRLRLTVRENLATRPGNTPVPHGAQASGLELTRYKAYTPGDELRFVDWNAYGRLDRMFVKTFRAEREAPLHLLIDTSASMVVPAADGKLDFAVSLAASLAYVALRRQDPVRIVALTAGGTPLHTSAFLRHPQRLPAIEEFLAGLTASGTIDLVGCIDAYLRSGPPPGVAIVLSDFLVEPAHYQSALERLRARHYTVGALRPIGPAERDPRIAPRTLRLHDVESGAERVIVLTPAHRQKYVTAVRDHLDHLRRWCAGRGIAFADPDTAQGLVACLLTTLPRAGFLH